MRKAPPTGWEPMELSRKGECSQVQTQSLCPPPILGVARSVPLFLSPWAEILTETNSSFLNLSPRVFCHIVTKVTSTLIIKVILNYILPNAKVVWSP